ncbi:hypothetical protein EPO56_01220 [Patescibacteria group bacterium]|nr:MAG: hypothetical protein EPO56_01220 [Patescibacteria group bacterium]
MDNTANTKRVIGVDLDDVLSRTGDAMAQFHNATYGTKYKREEVKTFDLDAVWNCTPEEAKERVVEFMTTDFHHDAKVVFGAYDALKKLGEFYDIVIVTGRNESMRDSTITWLTKNFLGLYREVHFTGHFDVVESKRRKKSDVVKDIGMSLFIDDALHFATDVAGVGVPVLLFDTPWNQGMAPNGVTRVFSWEEILFRISKMEREGWTTATAQ